MKVSEWNQLRGFYFVHRSGTLALWPGGPLKGSLTRTEAAEEFAR